MIEWLQGQASATTCPACGHQGTHPHLLAVASAAVPGQRLTLLVCDRCGSGFYDDRKPPAYENEDLAHYSVKFYVEKGAGIDTMLQPLAGLNFTAQSRYLEIGCGFGFSLDFLARMYGAEVRGIDPSALAVDGRKRLGLDIVNAYFDRGMLPSVAPRDVIYCSELIEHIEDPSALLSDIGAALGPQGVLILTTPAMEAVQAAAPEGTLLSVLSPGMHLILYTAGALEALLRRRGFTQVRIERNANSLIAYATLGAALPAPGATIPADRLIDYFRGRYDAAAGDALLRNGFLFRLVKHLVIAGRMAEAEALAGAVDAQFRDLYGIDITNPAEIVLPSGMADLNATLDALPLNLPGHLHFRGLVALLHHHDGIAAAAHFAAAARLAQVIGDSLARHMVADGELDQTPATCLDLMVHALRSLPGGPGRAALRLIAEAVDGLLAGRSGPDAIGPRAAADIAALAQTAFDLGIDAANTGDPAGAADATARGEHLMARSGLTNDALRNRQVALRRFLAAQDDAAGLAWLDATGDADLKAAVAWPRFVALVAAGDMAAAARYEPALAGHVAVRALAGEAVRVTFDMEALSFCSALAAFRGHHQHRPADAHRIYDMLIGAVEARPAVAGDQAPQVIATLQAGKAGLPAA